MKSFDKAKNRSTKSGKKWYLIYGKRYTYPFWALPLTPFVILYDNYKRWSYNRLMWSDEKATKMLNRILPKMLEWVEEDKAYYFCMDWGYSNYQYQVPRQHRAWVRKFASQLRQFVRDGYENADYIKEHENDGYDSWIKFSEKA